MKSVADALYSIAIALWIGGLWVIGFVVAPTLFNSLSDQALAGLIAGRLFTLVAYIGIVCALYVMLYRAFWFGGRCLRHGIFWVAFALLLLMLTGVFGVQPILTGLAGHALPQELMDGLLRERFATWHGIASALYLVESVLGVLLVWLQGRDPR